MNSTSSGSLCVSRQTSRNAYRADGALTPRVAAQMHALASSEGGTHMNIISVAKKIREKKMRHYRLIQDITKEIDIEPIFAVYNC